MPRSKPIRRPRKERKIGSRLMRGIIFIMLLTVLIPVIAYNNLPEWVYYLTPATRLWIVTEEISAAYEAGDLLQTLKDSETHYETIIEITDTEGRFVYSSRALQNTLPDDLSKAPPVDDSYLLDYATKFGSKNANGKGYLIKEYEGKNYTVTFLDCYVYLSSGDCVDVNMQVSQMSSTTKISMIVSFLVIMISIILALLVIYKYIKRITQPVDDMVKTTENMARLDFSKKCPRGTITELNSLADSINELSSALDTALTDLKEKNQKLEEDIENERTLDNLRQTFISGISHELKTPIAIIQGYAEGAKMFYAAGNAETADSYCDTIMQESVRMNEMIMKLLEITKYSSGAYEPEREDFELREFAQEWFDRNEGVLSEKGITYEESFKESFLNDYDNGMGPTEIFRKHGFDTGVLGKDRIANFTRRVKDQSKRETGFEDQRKNSSGRPRTKDLTDEERIQRLKLKIKTLKQENDFLKRVRYINRKQLSKQNSQQEKNTDSSKGI